MLYLLVSGVFLTHLRKPTGKFNIAFLTPCMNQSIHLHASYTIRRFHRIIDEKCLLNFNFLFNFFHTKIVLLALLVVLLYLMSETFFFLFLNSFSVCHRCLSTVNVWYFAVVKQLQIFTIFWNANSCFVDYLIDWRKFEVSHTVTDV